MMLLNIVSANFFSVNLSIEDSKNVTLLNKDFYKRKEEFWKSKLIKDFPQCEIISTISYQKQYFQKNIVLLRFHRSLYRDEVFVEVSLYEAMRYIRNLSFLRKNRIMDEFFGLEVQICKKNRKNNRYIFERDFFSNCYLNLKKLSKRDNLFFRKKTINKLYEKLMKDCIGDLLVLLIKNKDLIFSDYEIYYLEKKFNQLRVFDDNKILLKTIDISTLTCVIYKYKSTGLRFEFSNPTDINLIKLVNDLCDIIHNDSIKYLVFEGIG